MLLNNMRHKLYIIAILILVSADCLAASFYQSQRRRGRYVREDRTVRRYSDSLYAFRDSLYADSVKATPLPQIDTAPFFLPFTFYKNISTDAFSLDKSLSKGESQLIKMYLAHPELVTNTQSRLDKTGTIVAPRTITENPTSAIEKTMPDEPEPLPVDVIVFKPNFWNFGGDYYLQFLQNYLTDNWYQGGESNYSMMGSVALTANYNNKQKIKWDNKLEMKFGMQTTKSDSLHKSKPTEDLLRYTGKFGLQATKKWYYTFQLLAQTQWARHYNANSHDVQSDFFSPFNLNLSIGMDYNVDWLKGRLKGSAHLAPFAYNYKYVGRLALASKNGIDEGHHTLNDFGSQITVDLTWKFADNISWKTRLYGYTTYERMEAEWENTFSFQFNRYLATQIYLYPRFDDDMEKDSKMGYWMFKEFVSIGFTYSM